MHVFTFITFIVRKRTWKMSSQAMRKINEHFRHLVSSSGKIRKTDNNKKNKAAEKRTDGKEATKLDQMNFKNEYVVLTSFK